MSGLRLLRLAAEKFIQKCDHGRAQSKVTYAELKYALEIMDIEARGARPARTEGAAQDPNVILRVDTRGRDEL